MKNRMSHLPATLALAMVAALAVSGCEAPQQEPDEAMVVESVEDAEAVDATEQAAPVVAEVEEKAAEPAPTTEALPPSEKTSEESVQPESETLFY